MPYGPSRRMSTSLARSALRDAALAPATLRVYNHNVEKFLHYTRRSFKQLLIMHAAEVDRLLSGYIEHLHRSSSPYEHAVHAVFGVVYHRPNLRSLLGESRLRLRGWQRRRTSTSYPPLTWEVTCLLAVTMARSGHHAEAVACLLSFDCYLRVSEMTALRVIDVVMPLDPRLGAAFTGMALRLPKTKTGLNQWVSIQSTDVEEVFQQWMNALSSSHSDSPSALVFPFSPAHFRRLLRRSCLALGISTPYVPHSFRHGGATGDYLRGQTIEQVMYRGRWKSMDSARRYIQTGRALLVAQQGSRQINQLGALFADNLEEMMRHLLRTVPLVSTPPRRVTFQL